MATPEERENKQGGVKMAEKYKVKVGDEELEVTLDELLQGYMRQADYTRKTQALAEERKKLEEQLKELEEKAKLADQWNQWYQQMVQLGYFTPEGLPKWSPQVQNQSSSFDLKELLSEEKEEEEEEENPLYRKLEELTSRWEQVARQYDERLRRMEQAFRYKYDLDRLREWHRQQYPDIPFDEDRLLRTAQEYGKSDLTFEDWQKIHRLAYLEDLKNRELEQKLKEQLEAERQKLLAQGPPVSSEGPPPQVFKLPEGEGIPSSMEEAEQMALKVLQEERLKTG